MASAELAGARLTMRPLYLDYNATTPLYPAVVDAMLPYLTTDFGNASSVHSFGQSARGAVERAREQVAALIGANPAEIVFTSGGTESDNAAILGVIGEFAVAQGARSASVAGRDPEAFRHANPETRSLASHHIITTAIEHAAVLHTCQALERDGCVVTYLPVSSEGLVDPGDVRRALRPETVLISVMHANNELGTIQPAEEIGRVASEAGFTFHTDAVQSAGKIPVNVAQMGVQLLSISAHKIGGPKGVGALYVKKGTRLAPLMFGGHAERDRRAGTENVPGIVGFGKAAELARAHLAEKGVAVFGCEMSRIAHLRDRLEQGLLERVPEARVNCGRAPRTPNTCNMLFSGVESESLVIALDLRGIACSAGAACSSGATDPSHVLAAIGLSDAEARACVRFSLGPSNTEEEIAYALEIIPVAVAANRGVTRVAGAVAR